VVVGGLSAAGLLVLRVDAPVLFAGMGSWPAVGLVGLSVVAGIVSLVLLRARAYLAVRITASLAVVGVLWAWGAAQYPVLLPGATVESAAATDAVLGASLGALAVGALLIVPSLWWLYRTFQRSAPATDQDAAQ
jgi:cytochrome d ubiquinol oxidase subunit II